MTLSRLFIKILLFGGIAIVLFILAFWLATKKNKTNISSSEPFKSIVGTSVETLHVSYIVTNDEGYLLTLIEPNQENQEKAYVLPIGTVLNFKTAEATSGGVAGFTYTDLQGSAFVGELGEEVIFKFPWGYYSSGINDEPHWLYALTPWQKTPIPLAFYAEGETKPYQWPAEPNNPELSSFYRTLEGGTRYGWNTESAVDHNLANTVFEGIVTDAVFNSETRNDRLAYRLDEATVHQLKLNKLATDSINTPNQYFLKYPKFLNISSNYTSMIILCLSADTVESKLINYDLDGNIVDKITLSRFSKSDTTDSRLSYINKRNTYSIARKTKDAISFDIVAYQLDDTGKINKRKSLLTETALKKSNGYAVERYQNLRREDFPELDENPQDFIFLTEKFNRLGVLGSIANASYGHTVNQILLSKYNGIENLYAYDRIFNELKLPLSKDENGTGNFTFELKTPSFSEIVKSAKFKVKQKDYSTIDLLLKARKLLLKHENTLLSLEKSKSDIVPAKTQEELEKSANLFRQVANSLETKSYDTGTKRLNKELASNCTFIADEILLISKGNFRWNDGREENRLYFVHNSLASLFLREPSNY